MEIKDLKSFKEIKTSEASKVIGGACPTPDPLPPPPRPVVPPRPLIYSP